MKKATLIISALALVFSANAQTKGSATSGSIHKHNKAIEKKIIATSNRAVGDTLMYIPLDVYYVNATDQPNFTIVTQDLDGLNPQNIGITMDFGVYYSTDSTIYGSNPSRYNMYHPWETPAPAGSDTAFFWYANSWFAPPGQADNWLMFGSITVPASGAVLRWYDKTKNFRDGYEVLVSSAFSNPLDFGDFTGAAIFTETDDDQPSATWAVDTTWELKSVTIPSNFNGTQIAIAFHHTANDMDGLMIDEILMLENGVGLGVNEFVNGIRFSQNTPNPFSKNTAINYELENTADITINVYDVTGKKVASLNEGEQTAGKHIVKFNAESLSAGVYYYSLKVGNNVTSSKKMVIVK